MAEAAHPVDADGVVRMSETGEIASQVQSMYFHPCHSVVFPLKRVLYSSETPSKSKRKAKAKAQRKWGDEAPTESDMASLDFSYDSSKIGRAHV